jgi:hypothetical protein
LVAIVVPWVKRPTEVAPTARAAATTESLKLGRGHLRDPDLAVGDEHCVREGPADVDTERTHRVILGHGAE